MTTEWHLRQETQQFLRDLERSSSRKVNVPHDLGTLLEASARVDQKDHFEQIVFLAKFITKTFDIMKRIGPDGEGYDTLAREFQDNVEKVGEKIRKLLLTSPDNIQDHFARRYFRMEPESLENHMKLLADLTLVKNWMLDGKSLPT